MRGEYYDNIDFTNLRVIRTDPVVDFDWIFSSPHPLISHDAFAVTWIGEVEARYSETYTFYTVSDDGIRLWINNQLIIDDWNSHGAKENSGSIILNAGQKYNIKIEYYEDGGLASAKLLWGSNSQDKQVIPENYLYPDTSPVGGPTEPVFIILPAPGSKVSGIIPVTIEDLANAFLIYKEAESGQIISTFTVVNDVSASNGKYIDTPTGTPGTSSPTTEVSVPIDIPTTGTYYLWARIYGLSAFEDAIYVGFDGSFDRIFSSSFGIWGWIKVEATPGNFAFNLNAGNHAITIGHGEPRARIDVLALTNDPNFVPSGIP